MSSTLPSPPPSPPVSPSPALPSAIPPKPPSFRPFFPILKISSSSQSHHPHIHYIFASDPSATSPITAAALQALDTSPSSPAAPPSPEENRDNVEAGAGTGGAALLPTNKHERFVIVEVDATGTHVIRAESMSPAFAVTGAEIADAPAWGDGNGNGNGNGSSKATSKSTSHEPSSTTEGQEEGQGKNLMLKISGVEAPISFPLDDRRKTGKDKVGSEKKGEKNLEELREEYEAGLKELKKVVDARAQYGSPSTGEGEAAVR